MAAFSVDPASVARGHAAFWVALAIVTVVTAASVASLGRKAWWFVLFAALLVPTIATYPFGARPAWSMSYLPDVVLPLALVIGVPGGMFGSGIGAALRRWRLSVRARPT